MSVKKLVLALTLCSFIVAPFVAPVANAAEQGYVSVSSSVDKEVDPNRAEVSLYIETNEDTAQKASEKNKEITNAVIAAIKPEVATNASDSIKTSAFVVRPNYTWTKDNKKHLVGYTATNSIYVKTSNIQNIGKVIDLAIEAGANRVDSFTLSLDDQDKYCTDILQEAVKETKFKAGAIANALGTSIAGVKSVSTSCSAHNSSPSPYRLMMAKNEASAADSAGAPATPIEAGKIKIYANANASFYLK